jgi:hypothetical protein
MRHSQDKPVEEVQHHPSGLQLPLLPDSQEKGLEPAGRAS